MRNFLRALWRQEDAATAVEYAVLLALILVAIIGAIGSVGAQSGGLWGDIDSDLTAAGFGS
jgi:pilus assembly protein Flp/PilA